jgi:TonB family protein
VTSTSNRKVHGVTIAASIVVHAALTAGLSLLAYRTLKTDRADGERVVAGIASRGPVSVELPLAGAVLAADEQPVDSIEELPRITAGEEVARVDMGVVGHGGAVTERERALNLADEDERMRVSPDLLNHLDRDQLQRLRVGPVRASWEDRRSTTHPAELTFVATGAGDVFERRPLSSLAPSRGALASPPARDRGAVPGGASDTEEGDHSRAAADRGSREAAPGQGLNGERAGTDHRASAPIASARPDVERGPVAVPAVERALPKDDVEGRQEVATILRSIVHASSAGGLPGDGEGGTGGGGEAGAGAAWGEGSHARPLGAGAGDIYDYWTSDPRLVPYFRRLHAKIDPLWADAFPKSALLDLKQGTVILEFTVHAGGRAIVTWPPLRPSGVEEFDRKCADAIRAAAPFPPIPRSLGVTELRIRAPFVADNPMVK